jgi:ketosteroid isomerase-like protein
MKKNPIILAVVLFGLTALPSHAQSTEDLKAKVTRVNQEMAKAMMEGNTEKTLSFYTEDAISMPNNADMIEGLPAIRKSTVEMSTTGMKVKSFEVQTIYAVPCENMILEIGKFNIRFTMPQSDEVNEDAGKYLTIWEQQPDGSLKIKLETWNADASPEIGSGMNSVNQ